MSQVWNPVTSISEMSADGWYWDGLLRFEDRSTGDKQKEHMVSRMSPTMEIKVVKRGGSTDPHYRVLYRLVE
jgi:hypothetical protein